MTMAYLFIFLSHYGLNINYMHLAVSPILNYSSILMDPENPVTKAITWSIPSIGKYWIVREHV